MDDPAEKDLSRFCCLKPSCPDCGKRGAGNLSVCDRIGKHRQYRLLYCRRCKARFSERKGTPFFRSPLPPGKVVSILAHVQEGVGMRKTGRLVGVKEPWTRNTGWCCVPSPASGRPRRSGNWWRT